MKKVYLGIDIGSISTKGVIIDEDNKILASSYLYTEGSPITASKRVVRELKSKINLSEYKVVDRRENLLELYLGLMLLRMRLLLMLLEQ